MRGLDLHPFDPLSLQELGAETKARSTIAAVELVDFVKDPLNNDNVKVGMRTTAERLVAVC